MRADQGLQTQCLGLCLAVSAPQYCQYQSCLALEHPLSDLLAIWGTWEGPSGFPHPGFRGCGEEGDYCRCEGLGLTPAPVQLAGEVKSCILVLPAAS